MYLEGSRTWSTDIHLVEHKNDLLKFGVVYLSEFSVANSGPITIKMRNQENGTLWVLAGPFFEFSSLAQHRQASI